MTIRFVKPNPIVICSNPKPSNKLEEQTEGQRYEDLFVPTIKITCRANMGER